MSETGLTNIISAGCSDSSKELHHLMRHSLAMSVINGYLKMDAKGHVLL
jgi:hypothetical protein